MMAQSLLLASRVTFRHAVASGSLQCVCAVIKLWLTLAGFLNSNLVDWSVYRL
jgi:hypothetical protein